MRTVAQAQPVHSPDPAVLALARALARQAAREDHAAEQARLGAGHDRKVRDDCGARGR